MSIKSKVLAAAATLTLVSGVGAASVLTAGTASAATPSCGPSCINVFNSQFGPAFLMDVYKQGAKVGQPIILFRASNTDPALDFVNDFGNTTTVTDLVGVGLVSPVVGLHYGTLYAVEWQYQPYGVPTGLCVGAEGLTVGNGTPVALLPCGVSARTIWIKDTNKGDHVGPFVSFINGAQTNFSNPYVLTYPPNGYPTDMPRPQLYTHTLQKFSNPLKPYENQLWWWFHGVA